MFGIVLSALNSVLAWIFRSVLVKFLLYFALWFLTTEFIKVLQSSGILPSAKNLGVSFSGISAAVWYFLDLFAFSQGLPIVLSAFVHRFIIRRIPVIG